jgi:hypothetical protein
LGEFSSFLRYVLVPSAFLDGHTIFDIGSAVCLEPWACSKRTIEPIKGTAHIIGGPLIAAPNNVVAPAFCCHHVENVGAIGTADIISQALLRIDTVAATLVGCFLEIRLAFGSAIGGVAAGGVATATFGVSSGQQQCCHYK